MQIIMIGSSCFRSLPDSRLVNNKTQCRHSGIQEAQLAIHSPEIDTNFITYAGLHLL